MTNDDAATIDIPSRNGSSHSQPGTHASPAAAETSSPIAKPEPNHAAANGVETSHTDRESHASSADLDPETSSDQRRSDTQHGVVAEALNHTPVDAQTTSREGGVEISQSSNGNQREVADLDPEYFSLLIAADYLDDIEKARIAMQNRLRSLGQVKELDDSPMAANFQIQLNKLMEMEKEAIKQLQRTVKAHPLGAFVKRTVGLGEKQSARLLAATGDPGTRPNVAKLWAYCGFHVIDGKRPRNAKGVKSNWSNTAKMRARLCAESCIKQMHSPYRKVYDRERTKWEARETTDLHKHNHALSVVAKEILKDLWVEARNI